jgi:hypothetical protein
MKMIGKPYSGKPNVRFDEGELEIGLRHYASSLLYHYCSYEERPHSSLDDRTPHEAYWNLHKAGYPVKVAA